VVGHDHLPDQCEFETGADFAENLRRDVSISRGRQKIPVLIAREGNKVQIAASGDAFEVMGHKKKKEPTLAETRKGRPPGNAMLTIEALSQSSNGRPCVK